MTLIAIERGAPWPLWLDECRVSAGAVVVAQGSHESYAAYSERLLQRVAGLAVHTVVLAGCEAVDDRQRARAAAELIQQLAVAAAAADRPAPRFLLTARGSASDTLRGVLMRLWGQLAELAPSGTEVVLRFGPDVPESGVYPAARRSELQAVDVA